MHKEKTLSMLGMARKAGKLSMGHDMADKSIKAHKARLVILCSDASKRLCEEFKKKVENEDIPLIITEISMNEIHFSTGYKAGVMTLDDENFAKRVIELLKEE